MYLISDGGLNCNTKDTIEAIMLTKNIDYLDGVKLDVRKSKDNFFVLSKYNELNKLTLSNKLLNECNYSYLRKVKFPSHIFKYYIPTLEEILMKYDNNKIIVIELYDSDISNLYGLLDKYSYHYYFLSKNNRVLNTLHKLNFSKLGTIIDNYDKEVIKEDHINNTFTLNLD